MEDSYILKHVDHTLLKPVATWVEIRELCDEAVANGVASVCVPPSYVARIKDEYGDSINICTVIGFPLGYDTMETKRASTAQAIEDGAGEVDMVINIGDVKNGDFVSVREEIAELKKAANGHILKVIIETCYLTESEIIALCYCVTEGGADYIKTSTGFGDRGASLDDVRLMKAHIGPNVKIKASGGIRTREEMVAYLEAGCDRIGTSSAVKALTN